MANEGTDAEQPEVPRVGEPGYFCIELFCGSGNLTLRYEAFLSGQFWCGSQGGQTAD